MPDWSAEEFLTVAEVAALLKLNQQTIRNSDQGSLPALRVGRRVRVLRSDLKQLIDNAYHTDVRASQPGRGANRPQGAETRAAWGCPARRATRIPAVGPLQFA